MQEDKHTIRIEIPELGIEEEYTLDLAYDRLSGCPASNVEPYEPEIPAETVICSAEVQGEDVSFLLGDLELLCDRLHVEEDDG